MGDAAGEVELLITGYKEGTVCNAYCLPHFSNVVCVGLLECFGMQLSFQPQLPVLITAQHEYVSIGVDSSHMARSACNRDCILC